MRNSLWFLVFGIWSLVVSVVNGQNAPLFLGVVDTTTSATYLLDDYPADAAYSLRLLKADQIDSAAIRVRRSSDNAEQDIGFTSEGYLDTASLKTFVGANSGYVVTWYDQSGNERDLTNSTAAEQARITNTGSVDRKDGDVACVFDGSDDYYRSSFTLGNPASGFLVGTFAEANDAILDGYGLNNINSIRSIFGTNDLRLYNTSSGIIRTISYGTRYLISWFANGASSYLGTNATYTSGTIGTASMGGITVGRAGNLSSSTSLNGNIQEIIIYNSSQYSNRASIESEINTHYSIY